MLIYSRFKQIIMSYDKTIHSGLCWYVVGSIVKENGVFSNCIYGVSGIGSPHGDLAEVNNVLVCNRTYNNLIAVRYPLGIVIEQIK